MLLALASTPSFDWTRWCCAQPGVSTDEIDKAVHKIIIDNGAYPSPLTYGTSLLFLLSPCSCSSGSCACCRLTHGGPLSKRGVGLRVCDSASWWQDSAMKCLMVVLT